MLDTWPVTAQTDNEAPTGATTAQRQLGPVVASAAEMLLTRNMRYVHYEDLHELRFPRY